MNKSTRIVKKLLALFLVVLMSIESFAAVVGDNDGAAFITKAEFESLKNDFQTQINTYNTSLDAKIDGAIANYLNGIKVAIKKELKPLVENWKLIRWTNDIDIYGQKLTWNRSTKAKSIQDKKWFKPTHEDRRMFWTLGWKLSHTQFSETFNVFRYTIYPWTTNAEHAVAPINITGGEASRGAEVLYLRLQDLTDHCRLMTGQVHHFRNRRCDYFFFDLGTSWQGTLTKIDDGTTKDWSWAQSRWAPATDTDMTTGGVQASKKVTNMGTSGTELINLEVYAMRNNRNAGNLFKFRDIADATGLKIPFVWLDYDAWGDCISSKQYLDYYTQNPSGTDYDKYYQTSDAEWAQGMTVTQMHASDSTAQEYYNQVNTISQMMLGNDTDIIVNIERYNKASKHAGQNPRVLEKAKFWPLSAHIKGYTVSNAQYPWNADTSANEMSVDTPFTFSLPGWEQIKFKEIESGNYKVNGNYLQLGQGIPLIQDATEVGDLKISFDISTKYVLDLKEKNKNAYISLCKKHYLEEHITDNDYVDAYIGNVDTSKTTATTRKIKRYAWNGASTANGKVELTVPIKKGDNIWFRMAPQDTSGGYYVEMSNFKLILETQ